ncbi:hypothetical protein GQ53DRAFT_264429 [Thozetella sp. PMI_491]|nr:hypothetical protein GQ53DRAFT_264429 [Thozetella sp. PMI_491]
MASLSILRIPTEDGDERFILAQVASTGSRTLDVKLVATEGQAPYTTKLKHDNIEKLRVANSPSSSDEWETILTAVLYNRKAIDGVEAVAKIHDGQSIDVVIRRRVEGINQKLGTLTLKRKDNEAIDTLDWCSEAVLSREKAKAELALAAAKASELESVVSELKEQLEELIRAKRTDEAETLEKFRDLLNEKKIKIREQQQLLAAGPAFPSAVQAASHAVKEEPEASPPPQPKRRGQRQSAAAKSAPSKPATSARSKRKAAQAALGDDGDQSSDDGFEKMDVDSKPSEDVADLSEDQHTTDDDETGSDSDDAAQPPPRAGPSRQQPSVQNRTATSARQADKPKDLPPPRALPFNLGKKQGVSAAKPVAPAGSETDSDDEL